MKTFGDVNQVENVSTLLNELYFSCLHKDNTAILY